MPRVIRKLACRGLAGALALLVLTTAPGAAEQQGTRAMRVERPQASDAQAQRFNRGLLWRVEKPGSEPSYLFGTVHLADKRVTALPEAVAKALDSARSFTMEIALDPPNLAELAARMMFDDDRDLAAVAGDELFGKVVPLLAGLGVPQSLARRFRPWAVMLMLAVPPQNPHDVLDYTLHRIAAGQNKALYYLESVEDQVAAFESLSVAQQVALLRHAVATHDQLTTTTDKLLAAYLQRDLGRMWELGEESVHDRPELKALNAIFAQRLLFDRNARMVARMRPQLQSGRAFIAVGALHFYGDQGILSLLEQDSYRVSRVY